MVNCKYSRVLLILLQTSDLQSLKKKVEQELTDANKNEGYRDLLKKKEKEEERKELYKGKY
jgi:hypothetical protein